MPLNPKTSNDLETPKVVILRWGHRHRDQRLTSHVALTARALGASGFILADMLDPKVKETVERIVDAWGGDFFFEMDQPWKKVVKDWRAKNGVVVHLTAYGENIQTSDVMQRIQETKKDVLVIVGSQKVPGNFFSEAVSDFNVAVGNQPHSEASSLAIFLDRFFEGKSLSEEFIQNKKKKIIPQARGKRVIEV
ncbi:MAG: tRNA (cytidine(56)-2'-O)-methyltransferase [Candidatus Bathyarchaeota archaeon]|nr:tRNA (cytidine(56)-2'-O)-methyltransferase [Candidatus Bathyarchaeota archaeon]